MNDCEHLHIVRVAGIPPGSGPRKPQDGVYSYYCQDCHFTLYVRFTDAPPIVVIHGTPPTE